MAYFRDSAEITSTIGGFLQTFPRLEPLMREAVGHKPMVLKLELSAPEFSAEVDFRAKPLSVRLGAGGDGTIAMTTSADHFHQILLGMLAIGPAVNNKQILLRGAVANLMSGVPLFYLAPGIYPFYLESIGRADLVLPGPRPMLHGETISEDTMTRLVSGIAFLAGFSLGLLKRTLAPRLNLIAALEAMGKGLLSAASPGKNA